MVKAKAFDLTSGELHFSNETNNENNKSNKNNNKNNCAKIKGSISGLQPGSYHIDMYKYGDTTQEGGFGERESQIATINVKNVETETKIDTICKNLSFKGPGSLFGRALVIQPNGGGVDQGDNCYAIIAHSS